MGANKIPVSSSFAPTLGGVASAFVTTLDLVLVGTSCMLWNLDRNLRHHLMSLLVHYNFSLMMYCNTPIF